MNPSGINDCRVLCVFVTSLAVIKHQDQGNCWKEGFVRLGVPLWPNGHVVASAGKLRAHPEPQAGSRERPGGVYALWDMLPSARPYVLNMPHSTPMGTKYSEICAYAGYFHSNHHIC